MKLSKKIIGIIPLTLIAGFAVSCGISEKEFSNDNSGTSEVSSSGDISSEDRSKSLTINYDEDDEVLYWSYPKSKDGYAKAFDLYVDGKYYSTVVEDLFYISIFSGDETITSSGKAITVQVKAKYVNDDNEVVFETPLSNEIVLNAFDKTNLYYDVSFVTYFDDITYKKQSIKYKEKVAKVDDPSKTGYHFLGWFTYDITKEEAAKWDFDKDVVLDNITLFAQWSVDKYAVEWVVGDESLVEQYDYGSIPSYKKDTPTKESDFDQYVDKVVNYEFDGWDNEIKAVTGNQTYVAKFRTVFTAKQFVVSWNIEGNIVNENYSYGVIPTCPITPTKANSVKENINYSHTFDGWEEDDSNNSYGIDEALPAVTKNVTYIAKFTDEIVKHTVKFYNDNRDLLDSLIVNDGDKINTAEVEIPSLDDYDSNGINYHFAGWKNESEDTLFIFGMRSIIDDYNLYPYWEKSTTKCNVTFVVGEYHSDPITYDYGDIPSYDGDTSKDPYIGEDVTIEYAFAGWIDSNNNTFLNGVLPPVTNDETYTALYLENGELRDYDITWNVEGDKTVEKYYYNCQPSYPLKIPVKETVYDVDYTYSYTFLGWSLTPNGDVLTNIPLVDKETTYYAIFDELKTETKYTANFYVDNEFYYSEEVAYGSAVTGVTTPTKTGYTFTGWVDEFGEEFDISHVFTDINLYAKWNKNHYSVRFIDKDTTDVIDTKDVEYLDLVSPIEVAPKEGYHYRFIDENNDEVNFDTLLIDDNINIYLEYLINQYKVSFVANSSSYEDYIEEVEHGSKVPIPNPAPTKTYFQFLGWFTAEGYSGDTPFNFESNITDDLSLYAKWERVSYTITLKNQDDGSVIDTQQVSKGDRVSWPDTPVKVGHTFDKWVDKDGNAFDFENTFVNDDFDIFATYTANPIQVALINSITGEQITVKETTYGSTVSLTGVDTTYGDYIFDKWYTDSDCTTAFTTSTKLYDTLILYAGYKANVTFSYNGKSYVSTVKYNEKVTNPTSSIADLSKTHYTFDNWYSNETCTSLYDFNTPVTSDSLVIYAKYNPVSYTITFNSNGGSSVGDVPTTYNTLAVEPDSPTKTGYTFAGWFEDNNTFNDEWDWYSDVVTGNITLYAKWTINTYTINYHTNGGSALSSQNYNVASTTTLKTTSTKTGYTFEGWYLEEGLENKVTNTSGKHENLDVYAKWTANKLTVTFVGNGSTSGSMSTQTIYTTSAGTALTTNAFSRTGYTFDGWTDADNNPYSNQQKITTVATNNSTLTLTAKWKANTYSIDYSLDGGSVSGNPTSYTIESNDINLNNPTKTGYTFSGWTGSNGSTPSTSVTISKGSTGKKSYTANWNINQYTVTFHTNGGTAKSGSGASFATQNVNYGENAVVSTEIEKTGYTFDGWYLDSGFNNIFLHTPITSNIHLYAKWSIDTYTITLNLNGGTISGSNTLNYQYQEDISLPTPTRTGFTFGGWYTNSACTTANTYTKMPANNINLYAKWTGIYYTVTFSVDSNKATSAAPASQNVFYQTYATDPGNPTPKAGYTFTGWYKSGSTTAWDFENNKVTANMTLTAQLTLNSYIVTFESNGGTSISSQNVSHGGKVTKPSDPTRSGYVFEGWFSDPGFASSWNFTSNTVTANTNLYAKWTAKLATPNVTVSGQKISWSKITNAEYYRIYVGGVQKTVVDTLNYTFAKEDLTTDISVTVIAEGTGYADSNASTAVIVEKYNGPSDGLRAAYNDGEIESSGEWTKGGTTNNIETISEGYNLAISYNSLKSNANLVAYVTQTRTIEEVTRYLEVTVRNFVDDSSSSTRIYGYLNVFVGSTQITPLGYANGNNKIKSDSYVTYCYDLRAYYGTGKVIKIQNKGGTDLCVHKVAYAATTTYTDSTNDSKYSYTAANLASSTYWKLSGSAETTNEGYNIKSASNNGGVDSYIFQNRLVNANSKYMAVTVRSYVRSGETYGNLKVMANISNLTASGQSSALIPVTNDIEITYYYSLAAYANNQRVTIKIMNNGGTNMVVKSVNFSSTNGYVEKTKTLSTPSITSSNGSIAWTPVTNATYYHVYVNDFLIGETTGNNFTPNVSSLGVSSGYSIYIIAYSDTAYSEHSNTVEYFSYTDTLSKTYTFSSTSTLGMWSLSGKGTMANEGYILYSAGNNSNVDSYIYQTRNLLSSNRYLSIKVRTFVRDGETYGKLKLVIDNNVVYPIGSTTHTTINSDDYVTVTYDLAPYYKEGAVVKIYNNGGTNMAIQKITFASTNS